MEAVSGSLPKWAPAIVFVAILVVGPPLGLLGVMIASTIWSGEVTPVPTLGRLARHAAGFVFVGAPWSYIFGGIQAFYVALWMAVLTSESGWFRLWAAVRAAALVSICLGALLLLLGALKSQIGSAFLIALFLGGASLFAAASCQVLLAATRVIRRPQASTTTT